MSEKFFNSVGVGVCIILLLCLYQLYTRFLNASNDNKRELIKNSRNGQLFDAIERVGGDKATLLKNISSIQQNKSGAAKQTEEQFKCKTICDNEQHVCTKFCEECRMKYPKDTAYPLAPCIGNDSNFEKKGLGGFETSSYNHTLIKYPFDDMSQTQVKMENVAPHHELWKGDRNVVLSWGRPLGIVNSNETYTMASSDSGSDDSIWRASFESYSIHVNNYIDLFNDKTNDIYALQDLRLDLTESYIGERTIYELTQEELDLLNAMLDADISHLKNTTVMIVDGAFAGAILPEDVDDRFYTYKMFNYLNSQIGFVPSE